MVENGTILVLENVKVVQAGTFSNFSGSPTKWDRHGGKRYFTLEFDEALGRSLAADGWNVKFREPYREGDTVKAQLKVNFGWNPEYPSLDPEIIMIKGGYPYICVEETVGELDHESIETADVELRARIWDDNGVPSVTAYCRQMYVTVAESKLDKKWRTVRAQLSSQAADEVPFDA